MVKLRDVITADADQIAQIVNQTLSDPHITWRDKPVDTSDVLSWIKPGPSQKELFRVAETDGRVMGYATLGAFKPEPGYERTKELSIYISASARGAGLGKALLGDVLDHRQQHHQIISAIDASNEGSLKLHDGFGFERVGTLPGAGFVAGAHRDLILMMYRATSN